VRHYVTALSFNWLLLYTTFAQGSEKPNVILILSDDQGWNATSVPMDPDVAESRSDYYQTPNLEKLAARGMRFSSAYATPACSMTRAAIQTGKSPAALQFTDIIAADNPTKDRYEPFYTGQRSTTPLIRPMVADEELLIPEWLDQNNTGYATAHIGKWHIGNTTSHGYDYNAIVPKLPPGQDAKDVFRYSNSAIEFMNLRAADQRPFFLQISHTATHEPAETIPAVRSKYESLPRGTRHTNSVYAAMTETLDAGVGKILDKVEELGFGDNTYIIYASDNGAIAALGARHNDPLYGSKATVYEGGVRVPFIVAGPGVSPNSVSEVPVQLQDVFATVADIAGTGPLNPDVESASLLPVLHNGGELPGGVPLSRAYAPGGELFVHYPHFNGAASSVDRVPASAIRDGDYKLVKEYGMNGQPDKVLLFNLAENIRESSDPNSPLNLARAMPEKTAEMLAKLDRWLQDVDASLPYDMRDPVGLHWRAAQPGDERYSWRSVNDVDSYFRERWTPLTETSMPTLIASDGVSARLGGMAHRFDGDDVLSHEFFRVSDYRAPGVGDFDRSASVIMSFRPETLSHDQVLFESGDGKAGVSLTLGDADLDGNHDELRFRVLGSNLQSITVTATLTDFTDPTREFVEAAAVYSDDPASRHAAIYIDGVLAARVSADSAMGSLDWDRHNTSWLGYQQAGMGAPVGTGPGDGLGANGGAGDLPFLGAFAGEIAALSFYNYAVNPLSTSSRGDFNRDGFINAEDFTVWQVAMTSHTAAGDADGDSDSDGNDFLLWQQRLVRTGTSTTALAVPEPGAISLIAVVVACCLRRRK
jgi:arylsulfatase A-like enzyme